MCDAACVADIEAKEMVTTASGLQYRDIIVGTGAQAQVGARAVVTMCACLVQLQIQGAQARARRHWWAARGSFCIVTRGTPLAAALLAAGRGVGRGRQLLLHTATRLQGGYQAVVHLLPDAAAAAAAANTASRTLTGDHPSYRPTPQTGYQAVVHYVAMLPNGRIFENSLQRGAPYDVRCGPRQQRASSAPAARQQPPAACTLHLAPSLSSLQNRSRSLAQFVASNPTFPPQGRHRPGCAGPGRGADHNAQRRHAPRVHPGGARIPEAAQGRRGAPQRARQLAAHLRRAAAVHPRWVGCFSACVSL